jgi:hypothetical protein
VVWLSACPGGRSCLRQAGVGHRAWNRQSCQLLSEPRVLVVRCEGEGAEKSDLWDKTAGRAALVIRARNRSAVDRMESRQRASAGAPTGHEVEWGMSGLHSADLGVVGGVGEYELQPRT